MEQKGLVFSEAVPVIVGSYTGVLLSLENHMKVRLLSLKATYWVVLFLKEYFSALFTHNYNPANNNDKNNYYGGII